MKRKEKKKGPKPGAAVDAPVEKKKRVAFA